MIGEIVVCGILGGVFVTTTYILVQHFRLMRWSKRKREEYRRLYGLDDPQG